MPKPPKGALLQNLSIERGTSEPIYRQIDASLRRLILEGNLQPGQKLPSTRELADELGVSRITVKSVYEQLATEGFVRSKTGAGTFVAEGLDVKALPDFQRPHRQPRLGNTVISVRAKKIMPSKSAVRLGKVDPFRPGVPALELFPVKLWNKYLLDAAISCDRQNMSYGEFKGQSSLRQSIARHLINTRGMQVDPEQIIITAGAQQAFALTALVLLNPTDTVWYENPGHIAGREVLEVLGANVVPVPIDEEGMDINCAIAKHSKPALIFTTPSHQQPLGTTMSLSRRLMLLNYARESGAWIVEDDYDSEFRYRGQPLPALSALDSERSVFYVGTFSKSMFAAMRIGYVVVPPAFVEAFALAQNLLGQSSSSVVEKALSMFMDDGRFSDHIRKMRRVYRERHNILHDCLVTECADSLEPQPTDAGMHMLAWLKNNVDDQAAHRALLDVGIECLPLSVYCTEPLERSGIVLGFSGVNERHMPKLVKRMSETLRTL